MTTFRSLAIGAAALLLPFGVVACGGDDDTNSGSRPSESEISTALKKELGATAPDTLVDCVAGELHSSDLPNGVLRKLVAGDEAEVDKDNEDKYTEIITQAGTDCAAEAVDATAGT